MKKKRLVTIGGGTGSFAVLQGLKVYADTIDIAAVVTMADSGGSTGRLRDEFGQLPVGDIRMVLTALASEDDVHESLLRSLFLYRFEKGEGLKGHNFGNLLLVALTEILGSEARAIEAAAKVLGVRGKVLPVSEVATHLVATYKDGVTIVGEHEIDEPPSHRCGVGIAELSINPNVSISSSARDAILDAACIILGPGDLYTSVLANCVVEGMKEALMETKASLIYVSNLMTKAGQTDGFTVEDHVFEIERYIGRRVDVVLANTAKPNETLLARYAAEGEFLVEIRGNDERFIQSDILATETVVTSTGDVLKRSLIRHDAKKLAEIIVGLCR